MNTFLASKKTSDRFWTVEDGDQIAKDLASGSTIRYWLINETRRGVTLKRVIAQPVAKVKVERIEIVANGGVVGSADVPTT